MIAEVGNHRLGLPVARVVEILAMVKVSYLPGAPPVIQGLIDVRGQAVAVLDLRAKLGLEPRPPSVSDRLVVVAVGDRPLALRVDRVVDLVEIPASEVEDVRPLAGDGSLTGVARLAEGLLFLHDVDRFLGDNDVLDLERALARHQPALAEVRR